MTDTKNNIAGQDTQSGKAALAREFLKRVPLTGDEVEAYSLVNKWLVELETFQYGRTMSDDLATVVAKVAAVTSYDQYGR